MASLVIYCGNTLLREVKLGEGILRVGRSDQNDIVLVDPGKAVSRFHAELHLERGECTIVDLNSQNGTWVAGRRVQQVRLTPGTSALLGTYRLVFAEEAQQAAPAPSLPDPPAAIAPAAPAVIAPAAQAVIAPAALTPRPSPGPPPARASLVPRRRWGLAAATAGCIVLTGFAAGTLWPRPPTSTPASAAEGTVPGGPPTQTPGLATSTPSAPPAEPAIVSRPEPPQPKTPPLKRDPLEPARLALRRGDYPAAVTATQAVLRADPSNDQALDLLSGLRVRGHDAFKRARQLDAAGRVGEAARLYETALKLLPADHPSAITASERLLAIGAESR